MEKVKVSKEVAELLKKYKDKEEYGDKHNFYLLLGETVPNILSQYNMTLTGLARAFEFGWEVEYEFKVGDVVKNKVGYAFFAVDEGEAMAGISLSINYIKENKVNYTLICKAENREDIKYD